MAIPFYEPRPQHTSECDQVDGNFPTPPPAPSSPAIPVPTANSNASVASIAQPTADGTNASGAVSGGASAAAASTATPFTLCFTTAVASAASSSASPPNMCNTSTATNAATFSITTTNNAAAGNAALTAQPTSALEFSTPQTNFTTPSSSSPSSAMPLEPLPWKLLAVSMCKALKQYYQQNPNNAGFTTAVIEILPSRIATAAAQDGPNSATAVGH